jgi:hypothetical protein
MSQHVIDLKQYCSHGNIVLSGRDKGEEVRKFLSLDANDGAPGVFTVKVPTQVLSLNSSFFLGLFGPSVKKLGPLDFDAKYRFECAPIILEDIERGKREALLESNPLPKVR